MSLTDTLLRTLQKPKNTTYVEMQVYTAGPIRKTMLLGTRCGVTPDADNVLEVTARLLATGVANDKDKYDFECTPTNKLTVLSASAPVRVNAVLVDAGPVVNMGLHTLFVFTSPLISMQLVNESATEVDIRLIHS